MNNMIEALERIAAYPRSRSEEMSIGTAREIARAALASQAQQERKWVSVEDRLPPQSTDVLVYPMLSAYSHVAWHDGGCWRVTEYEKGLGEVHTALNDGLVTHWMPLPPAPEGEKE